MKAHALLFGFIISATLASSSVADEIVLRSGEVLRGAIQGKSLSLETTSGRVDAPFESIDRLALLDNGDAQLQLVDGSTIRGRLDRSELTLGQGLVNRVIEVSTIRSVRWTPPPVTVPAGTSVPLQLARSMSSSSSHLGDPVPFCTTEKVEVGGRGVIAKHAPASGQILGTGGGRNVLGGEKIGFSASKVLAVDGSWIPLTGHLEVEGGFDPGKGLFESGSQAIAEAGTLFGAETQGSTEVQPPSTGALPPETQIQVDACREYFKFAGRDVIPLQEMAKNQDYAPVPQPFRVSIPLAHLFIGLSRTNAREQIIWQLRHLESEGVSIPNAQLSLQLKRHGTAILEISFWVAVRPSHDRWVALKYDLSAGGKTIKSLTVNRIDAEERKTTLAKSKFELTKEEFDALRAAPDPALTVAMTSIYN